jgi:octaprenyl-diphosphate synthase
MQQTISGQALELTVETYPDWERYRDISIGKTAPLFIAPVEGVAELAGRYDVITPITRFFTAAGGCYQIANDMLNVTGTDGAESPASDMLRRAPNAVIVMFRNTLSGAQAEAFDSWLASGTTKDAGYWQDQLRQSRALALTARKLRALAAEAESCASTLASDCQAVITPLNAQLRHLCLDLANSHG